ncbi:MAG: hypothetical protein U0235_32485 [Polyangiaceae bacterium]
MVDFSGVTCGSNGIVYVKAAQGGQAAQDAASTVVTSSFLDTGASPIENATTSFVVIRSPSAPIVQTTDYDTNDDGTLELPSGAIIVDGVSTFDESPTAHDRTYAPRLSQPKGTADGATRFPGDTTPLSVDAWYAADLPLGSQGDLGHVRRDQRDGELPSDGAMTPGAVNVGTLVDDRRRRRPGRGHAPRRRAHRREHGAGYQGRRAAGRRIEHGDRRRAATRRRGRER